MDPSDVARKVVESNLRVVWRGSQLVNLVYIYMYVTVKCGGIAGGAIITQFFLRFLILCIVRKCINIFLSTSKSFIHAEVNQFSI
jgi:hypothetical protein